MVASARADARDKWVATIGLQTTLCTFRTLVPCPFSAGLPRSVCESSSDESLQALANPSEDKSESQKLSLEWLPRSLEQNCHYLTLLCAY